MKFKSRFIFLVSGLLFSLGVIYVYTGTGSEESGLKDLTKITDNLEGNSIVALPPSNSTLLARQKKYDSNPFQNEATRFIVSYI